MDTNEIPIRRRDDALVGSPRLTRQEAEQHTRDLIGAVLDARENAGTARQLYREGAFAGQKTGADALIAAQDTVINRQSDLLAELTDLIRKAVV